MAWWCPETRGRAEVSEQTIQPFLEIEMSLSVVPHPQSQEASPALLVCFFQDFQPSPRTSQGEQPHAAFFVRARLI